MKKLVNISCSISCFSKKTFILLCFVFASLMGQAASWTVKTVPNTRLESNDIHVSDPDDLISDSCEMHINTALEAIRDKADVFLVALKSIGEDSPEEFSEQLFNYWLIGDAKTENGVLMLLVEDQRAFRFEVGYGAESIMTDAHCRRIVDNKMIPFFKNGDYEGGLKAGVAEVVSTYGGTIPDALITTLPQEPLKSNSSDSDYKGMNFFFVILSLLAGILPFSSLFTLLSNKNSKTADGDDALLHPEKEINGIRYYKDINTKWSGSPWEGKGCARAALFGLTPFLLLFLVIAMTITMPDDEIVRQSKIISIAAIVLYLTWICVRHNSKALKEADKRAKRTTMPKKVYEAARRNGLTKTTLAIAPWIGWAYKKKYQKRIDECDSLRCPDCDSMMTKDTDFQFTEDQKAEMDLQTMVYEPYRCPSGHQLVMMQEGKNWRRYKRCDQCGALTAIRTDSKVITEASYTAAGQREEKYECKHCGAIWTALAVIPMLVHHDTSTSSHSSSHHSSSSSSHHSGGSFGGGHSGGGGYTGHW